MDCGTSHHRKRRREFIHFYFQIFMGVETSNPTILQYHGIVHGKFSEIFSSPGHRPPPTVVHPLKKYFLVVRFWWNKSQNLGLDLNFLFVKKKLKKFSTFSKKSKTKFSKKCEFWPSFFLRTNQKILRNPTFSTFGTILGTDSKKKKRKNAH